MGEKPAKLTFGSCLQKKSCMGWSRKLGRGGGGGGWGRGGSIAGIYASLITIPLSTSVRCAECAACTEG